MDHVKIWIFLCLGLLSGMTSGYHSYEEYEDDDEEMASSDESESTESLDWDDDGWEEKTEDQLAGGSAKWHSTWPGEGYSGPPRPNGRPLKPQWPGNHQSAQNIRPVKAKPKWPASTSVWFASDEHAKPSNQNNLPLPVTSWNNNALSGPPHKANQKASRPGKSSSPSKWHFATTPAPYSQNPSFNDNPRAPQQFEHPRAPQQFENTRVQQQFENPRLQQQFENPRLQQQFENPRVQQQFENPRASQQFENPRAPQQFEQSRAPQKFEHSRVPQPNQPYKVVLPTEGYDWLRTPGTGDVVFHSNPSKPKQNHQSNYNQEQTSYQPIETNYNGQNSYGEQVNYFPSPVNHNNAQDLYENEPPQVIYKPQPQSYNDPSRYIPVKQFAVPNTGPIKSQLWAASESQETKWNGDGMKNTASEQSARGGTPYRGASHDVVPKPVKPRAPTRQEPSGFKKAKRHREVAYEEPQITSWGNNGAGDHEYLEHEEDRHSYSQPIFKGASTYDSFQNQEPVYYAYEYKVNDPETGDMKGHKEKRDGDKVEGYYMMMEADGSMREVHYTADDRIGFVAKVTKTEDPNLKHHFPNLLRPHQSYHWEDTRNSYNRNSYDQFEDRFEREPSSSNQHSEIVPYTRSAPAYKPETSVKQPRSVTKKPVGVSKSNQPSPATTGASSTKQQSQVPSNASTPTAIPIVNSTKESKKITFPQSVHGLKDNIGLENEVLRTTSIDSELARAPRYSHLPAKSDYGKKKKASDITKKSRPISTTAAEKHLYGDTFLEQGVHASYDEYDETENFEEDNHEHDYTKSYSDSGYSSDEDDGYLPKYEDEHSHSDTKSGKEIKSYGWPSEQNSDKDESFEYEKFDDDEEEHEDESELNDYWPWNYFMKGRNAHSARSRPPAFHRKNPLRDVTTPSPANNIYDIILMGSNNKKPAPTYQKKRSTGPYTGFSNRGIGSKKNIEPTQSKITVNPTQTTGNYQYFVMN